MVAQHNLQAIAAVSPNSNKDWKTWLGAHGLSDYKSKDDPEQVMVEATKANLSPGETEALLEFCFGYSKVPKFEKASVNQEESSQTEIYHGFTLEKNGHNNQWYINNNHRFSGINRGFPSLDAAQKEIDSFGSDDSSAKPVKSKQTSAIKGADKYSWYTVSKPINIDTSKGGISLYKGDKYGVRKSSSGKDIRIVTERDGVNKVHTIDSATAQSLAKISK